MTQKEFKLIKPLIHPDMKPDETPLGYLIRIAELNRYKTFNWLATSDSKPLYIRPPHRLYELLDQTEWSGCRLADPIVSEVLSLDTGYFVSDKLRFCPLCIKDYGYYKIQWQYKVSVACKEHGIWLHDCCPGCGRPVVEGDSKVKECNCGIDITTAETEKVAEEVLLMQGFFEGVYDVDTANPLMLCKDHALSKKERCDILNFFSRWLRGRLVTRTGVSRNLSDMATARDSMTDVAEAIFSGREGYHNFLRRLHALDMDQGANSKYVQIFTRFYRAFFKEFSQACFLPYKNYIEQYLNMYWEKPVTRRNRHFTDEMLNAHPWLPFQTACRNYDIRKTELHLAIKKQLVRNKTIDKEKRTLILIYKPDLEARLYRIKDPICAREAALILGLTKTQFSRLREKGCFDVMVPPGKDERGTWQFSRDEIYRYRDLFLEGLPEASGDYWSLTQLMQFYGGQIEDPLITILNAVERKELKISAKLNMSLGLSSMLFDRDDFLKWYEYYKAKKNLLSIPSTAKLLGVQQQFAYQLIENGLIETSLDSDGHSRWVSQEAISDFHNRYILLSKLAKKVQLSSRCLLSYLASREIYSVDREWEEPLRQKVYEREELANVQLLSEYV